MDKNTLLTEARRWSLFSLGTKHIFDRRIRKYGRYIALLTVLGLITPLLLGGLVLGFDLEPTTIKVIQIAAGILSLGQVAISAWAIVYKWSDNLAYSQEASHAHYLLHTEYNKILQSHSATESELQRRLDLAEKERVSRDQQDLKIPPSETDIRRGYRYALYMCKYPCEICNQIPKSMIPSNCETCGNF